VSGHLHSLVTLQPTPPEKKKLLVSVSILHPSLCVTLNGQKVVAKDVPTYPFKLKALHNILSHARFFKNICLSAVTQMCSKRWKFLSGLPVLQAHCKYFSYK
jgi:hypothetical protein